MKGLLLSLIGELLFFFLVPIEEDGFVGSIDRSIDRIGLGLGQLGPAVPFRI
jgi:hypothetical protein